MALKQFTLPPDTRAVGTGNPPADVNGLTDAAAAMGASLNVLNAAFAGGADPTGATDSYAAIQAAINAVPSGGGEVYFPPGVYASSGALIVDHSYVTLRGAGYGFATQLTVPAGTISRTAAIILGNTAAVNQCTVRDLAIVVDGGTHAVNAGTGHGIVIAGNNCLIENVIVRYCSGDAFHFGQDLLNTATQTTIASGSNGQSLPQGTISVASTSGFASSGQVITRQASGACAIITYTGTSGGNSLTGCQESFGGSSYTMATGDAVIPVSLQFDASVINTYAMNFGGNGYYADWTYFSCEWLDARALGASSKPGASTGQNGFLIYGGSHKFVTCHPYFCAGNGMQIGDAHSFSAQDIVVMGGEYESNTGAGIYVTNNQGTVVICDGANFYGQGLSGSGEDIFLGFASVNVRITDCVFHKTSASLNPQNIYAYSSTYGVISNCVFYSPSSWSIKNIALDGASGAVSYFQIFNNRMLDGNSAAVAIQLKGATSNCTVRGNITDASIQEVVSGSTPSGNNYWDNTFIPTHSAALTVTGSEAPLLIAGGLATGTGAAATSLSNASTIATAGATAVTVTNSGAVTGIIMAAGSQDGQLLWVTNEGTGSVTFAASGTSNVADGTADVIAVAAARQFLWSSLTSLWYPLSAADATTANILPVGNTAAGANGKWADSGHVHAVGSFQPADVNLIAWNYDPIDCPSAISAVNGSVYMLQIILRSAQTITNGGFFVATAATTATATQNYMALVDSGGVIRASTASGAIDTATQSGGWLSHAFSSTYAAPAGKYYLAVLLNASTPLKFGAKTLNSSGGTEAGVGTASAFRYAVNGTGATALPGSFTLSSNTHTGGIFLSAGVS